jgi:hypothetical protein
MPAVRIWRDHRAVPSHLILPIDLARAFDVITHGSSAHTYPTLGSGWGTQRAHGGAHPSSISDHTHQGPSRYFDSTIEIVQGCAFVIEG